MSNPLIIRTEQQVEAQTANLILPKQYIGILDPDNPTPSVKNLTRLTCQNLFAVDITNFLDGQEGQEIIILGDGNTSVIEGLYITPKGGDHVLEYQVIYRFILFNEVWIEG